MDIPIFKYHPDPVATGSVKSSDAVCRCCGQARGMIYAASVYAEESLEDSICPWCIADGSAAQKFEATFSDDIPLIEAGLPDEVIEEVTTRTPGYNSWQQETWQSCCEDACEFHGDAPRSEVLGLHGDALAETLAACGWDESLWTPFVQNYQTGANPAVHKFVCRHCGKMKYGVDFT